MVSCFWSSEPCVTQTASTAARRQRLPVFLPDTSHISLVF